jgi:dTDP-4-amino-4,6-dideoxygalactose transaminase
VTESIAQSTIALPFYNNLSKDQVAEVCRELRDCIDKA